jgi:hypothetical protein
MDESKQDERRKHARFSDRILAGANVELKPCPPLYGELASGYLTDLSAGGMALIIPDLIPKNVFIRMSMVLPDGFKLESVVTVKRVVRMGRGNDYLHGFEFLNPSPEMIEHIDRMAADILSCNDRTKNKEQEICLDTCMLRQICKRPQCVEKNVRPAIIELTQQLKRSEEIPQDDWEAVKARFKNYLKAA